MAETELTYNKNVTETIPPPQKICIYQTLSPE